MQSLPLIPCGHSPTLTLSQLDQLDQLLPPAAPQQPNLPGMDASLADVLAASLAANPAGFGDLLESLRADAGQPGSLFSSQQLSAALQGLGMPFMDGPSSNVTHSKRSNRCVYVCVCGGGEDLRSYITSIFTWVWRFGGYFTGWAMHGPKVADGCKRDDPVEPLVAAAAVTCGVALVSFVAQDVSNRHVLLTSRPFNGNHVKQ